MIPTDREFCGSQLTNEFGGDIEWVDAAWDPVVEALEPGNPLTTVILTLSRQEGKSTLAGIIVSSL